MPINIKQGQTSDIKSLFEIIKNVISPLNYYNEFAKTSELNKYSPQQLNEKIAEDPDSVLIAEEDNEIVGFCISKFDDMLIWIEWFGVIEKARNKGIAKELVANLESTVLRRNAHKVWCDCRTENIKSSNLLSSSGYQKICILKNHWYGQDFILWQKEL